MLTDLWRTLRVAAFVVGILLTFFAVIEVLRAYQTLHDLHPALGWSFGAVLAAGAAWLAGYYTWTTVHYPLVLLPPSCPEPDHATLHELRRYVRYLVRVMRRLGDNARLDAQIRSDLSIEAERLSDALSEHAHRGELIRSARECETETLRPALEHLNQAAESEVRNCVRDVMLGVTLSPWRSADLVVVLYRNTAMVGRVVRIYNSRPRLREQLLILRDVRAVVATVNFINYGARVLENLTTSVPLLGRLTGDIAQGVGAGLLTSAVGHTAIDRCRTYHAWDRVQAQAGLAGKLRSFLGDIKGIVADVIMPRISRPVEAQAPEGDRRQGLTDRVREGVIKAIDDAGSVMDTFVRKPATAAGRGVANTGVAFSQAALRTGRTLGGAAITTARSTAKGTVRGLRAVGRAAQRPFRRSGGDKAP